MALRWGLPIDELYLQEMDMEPPIPHGLDEELGEQTRNRIIQ